jgi:uncharacterized membrane protein
LVVSLNIKIKKTMASKSQLEKAAAKTAEAIKSQSLQVSAWENLRETCKRIGITLSLVALGCSVSAQNLAMVDNSTQAAQMRPKVVLRGITGETFTLKSGQTCEVWMHTDGRKYVLRANGRKYFPKRLNRSL